MHIATTSQNTAWFISKIKWKGQGELEIIRINLTN